MGVLVVRQEGEKLYAIAPGGDRMELVPESSADRFIAQPVGAAVRFERGTAGVVAVIVVLPNGREVKGNRTP